MKPVRALLVAAAIAAFAGGIAWLAGFTGPGPSGVVPIAWDRETCAECRMHIGDPRFAAQLQTRQGPVLNFDDPGCLLLYQRRHRPEAAAVYFHHYRQDLWLAKDEVGFARVERTPMGYGLGAVGTKEADVPLAQAREALASAPPGPQRQP